MVRPSTTRQSTRAMRDLAPPPRRTIPPPSATRGIAGCRNRSLLADSEFLVRPPRAGIPPAWRSQSHQGGDIHQRRIVGAHAPDIPQEAWQLMGKCAQLWIDGDRLAKQGQWDAATERYVGALHIIPGYTPALYGLAHCAGAAGDVQDEISFYRHAIYSNAPWNDDGRGFREEDPTRLLTFALILNQTGQDDEALTVYNHAIARIDYEDGKPSIPILLPELGPGGVTDTPPLLQAMAQLALGVDSSDQSARMTRMTEAIRLAPDSVAANYYLGDEYYEANNRTAARPYFERARQLGDASVRALVDIKLRWCPGP